MNEASVISYESARTAPARPLWPAYACESLASVGSTMLQVGIFFYTEQYFRWGLPQNFALAVGFGIVYTIGSLLSHGIATRLGRRRGLIGIHLALTFIPLIALATSSVALIVAAMLAYTFVSSMNWPLVESLVSSDADAHAMSKRVGLYNLVWSATNAVVFAGSGWIIDHAPGLLFAIPAMAHGVAALIMTMRPQVEPAASVDEIAPHAEPEPELLAKRTLAMWLSRISLPAVYVVVYSLGAMMPSLPVMRPLDAAQGTLVGSVWMLSRFAAFLYLGMTLWWHTRPRVLLAAAAIMLVAFIGVTVRPSDIFGAEVIANHADLASMIGWQLLLGAMMGVIYSGSLYFGMVLSDGSTEHGGYHEALIGLGTIIGPGTALLTQLIWRGDLRAGVIAVCAVVGMSVFAAGIATVKASRRPTSQA